VLPVAYQPDGARLASAGDGGTVRIWDAATGEPVDWYVAHLPNGDLARWHAATGELSGATSGAWEWLDWNVILDGALTRLPVETYGPLPPITAPPAKTPPATSPLAVT
jgi:hypothetical protein